MPKRPMPAKLQPIAEKMVAAMGHGVGVGGDGEGHEGKVEEYADEGYLYMQAMP